MAQSCNSNPIQHRLGFAAANSGQLGQNTGNAYESQTESKNEWFLEKVETLRKHRNSMFVCIIPFMVHV